MNAAFLILLLVAPQAAPDTVVVCPEEFRAALAPWLGYRSQQGHAVAVISNLPSPEGIRRQIREIAKQGALHYVVLAGSANPPLYNDLATRGRCVPTHYAAAKVNVRWGSEPHIATDNYYADLDDDQLPELAIGRLSATTPAELATIVEKTIAYEQSSDFGPWRRQLSLVAGIGGFDLLTDAILESDRAVFHHPRNSGKLPAGHGLCELAQPLLPRPAAVSRDHRGIAQRGRLVLGLHRTWPSSGFGPGARAGRKFSDPHGRRRGAVAVPARRGGGVVPFVLRGGLRCQGRLPGPTHARRPRWSGGHTGRLAGTMPYGMAVMVNELMDQFFQQHCATLGDAILQAKRKMVREAGADDTRRATLDSLASAFSPAKEQLAAERAEHVLLFNLLGDPLLRLRYPRQVDLTVGDGTAGTSLVVAGVSPVDGPCTVELTGAAGHADLSRTPPGRVSAGRRSLKQFQHVYQRQRLPADGDRNRRRARPLPRELNVPKHSGGHCLVRVFVSGQADCASASGPEIKGEG